MGGMNSLAYQDGVFFKKLELTKPEKIFLGECCGVLSPSYHTEERERDVPTTPLT